MKTLLEIYNKHKKGDWPDKGSTHSYIEVYEEILKPYRTTAKNILEIGLMSGESLRMWAEYFSGDVYGIDCDVKPINGQADLTQAIKDGLKISIADATNPEEVEKCFFELRFDVILEDAQHSLEQQLAIFKTMEPYLNYGGIYIIEDVQSIQNAYVIINRIGGKIIDLRGVKNRYDDLIIIIKN